MEIFSSNIRKVLTFSQKEIFSYISGKGNPEKMFIFQEKRLSYISGGHSKAQKKQNFLYFSKKNLWMKFSKKDFKIIVSIFSINWIKQYY